MRSVILCDVPYQGFTKSVPVDVSREDTWNTFFSKVSIKTLIKKQYITLRYSIDGKHHKINYLDTHPNTPYSLMERGVMFFHFIYNKGV